MKVKKFTRKQKIPSPAKAARVFKGSHTLQIAMPLGGIGAGCVAVNGFGGIQDFSIRHNPNFTSVPDGHSVSEAAFALLHVKGTHPVTKLVEGPFPPERIYDQGLQAQGYRKGGYEGLPRFEKAVFTAEYPFGHVDFSDPQIPLKVRLTAWSPFIPLDDKNSGIPCAILEYRLTNSTRRPVDFEFSYHLSHLASQNEKASLNAVIPGKGVYFHNQERAISEAFGSASLTVIGHSPKIKAMWLRGPAWCYESISALWREVSEGRFQPNTGSGKGDKEGRNGGSILMRKSLKPGETVLYPLLVTWHFPNSNLQQGQPPKECATPDCCPKPGEPAWHPYYSRLWKDAGEAALYVHENYQSLRERTLAFKDDLFSSSLPPTVLDAVSSNLAILKSPTVLRQDSGHLWGWEGCFTNAGCCSGSCTHVWNYAQAFPHLFPSLERTLRDLELVHSIGEEGHVTFRSALPVGPTGHGFHAAADGQCGGILKVYRDWQISGDEGWLRQIYPSAKKSMDYCIGAWDPDRRGALFEPHHNTYDIEFWGPDGMCTSIYLGALSAISQMAKKLGREEEAKAYGELAQKAADFMDRELFNGDYYEQKVMVQGLKNTSLAQTIAQVDDDSPEELKLLKKEGPKYQYGRGCLSDGVIGAWMAKIYGIETPLQPKNIKRHLASIYRHNYRRDLNAHANPQRPGYAMGHEPGLILCTWPQGGKPTLPFIYSDEVWTGIEYQVASHLIEEGMVQEGLEVVRAVRSRYNGRVRNPFNEYECGSYYARAMASFALLNSLSGFRYSAVDQALWFGPRIAKRPFRSFFSTASGYGVLRLDRNQLTVEMREGELRLEQVTVFQGKRKKEIKRKFMARGGQKLAIRL
jgi:uncharacterized protein (DUF608 family)